MAQQQPQSAKNIFPLHVLKVSQNSRLMVELKSGEIYNGVLVDIDKYMNIKLKDCILTDAKSEQFREIKEVYIRGNVLKYFVLENGAVRKIQGTQYKAPQRYGSSGHGGKSDKSEVKKNKINAKK